ncbi:endonuclease [Liquorilactobacillus mali]|nr:phage endonuclease [Liquorilactobacillus mali KCTC 3596 = DSM 20444]QFQ74567.1 endonuclease [Liquorilactobacillus mali]
MRAKTDWEQSYYGTGQGRELKSIKPIRDIKIINMLMKKEHD